MLAVMPWVSGLAYVALVGIRAAVGLRVPSHIEEMGMDK